MQTVVGASTTPSKVRIQQSHRLPFQSQQGPNWQPALTRIRNRRPPTSGLQPAWVGASHQVRCRLFAARSAGILAGFFDAAGKAVTPAASFRENPPASTGRLGRARQLGGIIPTAPTCRWGPKFRDLCPPQRIHSWEHERRTADDEGRKAQVPPEGGACTAPPQRDGEARLVTLGLRVQKDGGGGNRTPVRRRSAVVSTCVASRLSLAAGDPAGGVACRQLVGFRRRCPSSHRRLARILAPHRALRARAREA